MESQVLDGFPHQFGDMSKGNINSLIGAHPSILFSVDEEFIEIIEQKEFSLLFVKGDNPCLNIESHFAEDGSWVIPRKKNGYFIEGRTIARILEGSIDVPPYARNYIKENIELYKKCEVYLTLNKPGVWNISVKSLEDK